MAYGYKAVLTMEGMLSYPTKELWEWAIKYRFKDGKVQIMQTDSNKGEFIPSEEVFLSDAACVDIILDYNRYGSSHFCTTLTITANKSVLGDTEDWVRKNWNLEY